MPSRSVEEKPYEKKGLSGLTIEEFMYKLQEYYGPYYARDGRGQILRDQKGDYKISNVKKYVVGYLRKDVDTDKLQKLLRYIMYYRPANFGPPDIAGIEQAIKEARGDGKGIDLHKQGYFAPAVETIPEEELEEGRRLLKEVGGLSGLMKSTIKNVKLD